MKKLFLLLAVIVATTMTALAQTKTVSGVVLDAETDEGLPGATVQPVGGGTGVAADINGRFSFTVPASVKEVKVSSVGMVSKTVPVGTNLTIKLTSADQALNQVVVTGYGTGKKLGSLVGSVSVVGDQVLEDTPSSNFVDALQGQVAGLTIFSNSGDPSEVPSSIRIRGVNSLNASTTPLFILDGAPVSSAVFTTLNPSDIESVTVLKDAASTAIYGSRAANGVIVITTKKGSYGEQANVTVRASVGWSERAENRIKTMNSQQYIQFRDMINQPVTQEVRDLVNNYGINTNWFNELIDSSALLYSLDARVQGGSEKSRYYLSLNHYDQDGIIVLSGIRRDALRFNLDSKVTNWFQVGFSGNLGYEKYENNAASSGRYYQNPFSNSYALLPYDAPYYYTFDENGNMVKGAQAEFLHYSQSYNPNYLSLATLKGSKSTVTFTGNLYEQITPIKGLTLRAQQAVTGFDYRNSSITNPIESFVTPMGDFADIGSMTVGYNGQSFQRYYQFTYTNTAEYKFNINDLHYLTFLIGQESILSKNSSFSVYTEGQPNSTFWMLNQGTDIAMGNVGQNLVKSVINSYFFNANYEFDSRYYFDFNVRRDGSSKFSPDHRWATFFAVGAMWDAKNEAFLQPATWLDALRFRINYGTTGNSGISDYMYQGSAGTGRLYAGQSSMGLASQSIPDLSWETVRSFDVGFDFGIFNRFRGTFDFYVKNTHDMLLEIPYSYTTGYGGGWGNVGSMRNLGVDVDVNADIYRSKDWYVGAGVNFGYNKNTITELFNGLDKFTIPGTGVTYEVGKNPYDMHNVKYAGVDPRDGQQMWYDRNGNLTKQFNEEEDEVALGKSFIAPWNGGFNINARWKGLSVRADFNWSAQKYILNATYWYIKTAEQCQKINGSVDLLNVWTKPGDVTDIPNLTDLYGNPQAVQPDSRMIENASFMRLKNLTIQYNFPKNLVNSMGLADLALHFTARNLFTVTGFTGIDPEYEANVVHFMYPNTKNYEFGIEVSF